MRLVYLPLDSRPCNYDWPCQLLNGTGHTIVEPEMDGMDLFQRPSLFEDRKRFLLENAEKADALILSVDQLCYGSLLASRSRDTSLNTAIERLSLLSHIKQSLPRIQIHAFSVIMRASISALCHGDLEAYKNTSAYSLYSGKARDAFDAGEKELAFEYEKLARGCEAALCPETLKAYREVRSRNHEVNMECVRLAANGIFDSLLLLQEDAPEYGFHKMEQRELLQRKADLNADHVWLHNGADEGGLAATAHAISSQKTKVNVIFSGDNPGFTALYEDRPFRENVESYMNYLNMAQDHNAGAIVIHCPKEGIQHEASRQTEYRDSVDETLRHIETELKNNKKVYLLDVAYANGGSLQLIDQLKSTGLLDQLSGYCAWNTATNALGTILSQRVIESASDASNQKFKWERILDDGIYQSYVRQRAGARLASTGEDSLNLKDKEKAERLVRELFRQKLVLGNWQISLHGEGDSHGKWLCDIGLPWNRLFEVRIRIE